jgi:hypothetical protein
MVKSECAHFLDEIADCQSDIVQLQADLAIADTQEKPLIAAQIKKCQTKVARLKAEFDECEGIPPLPSPINAALPATITVATDDARFPSLGPVFPTLTFTFSQQGFSQVAMGFPPTVLGTIPVTFLGLTILSNTVTARVVSGGQGSYARGDDSLSIPTGFVLDHSAPFLGQSTFSMTLTTGTVPTFLPPGTLVGAPISRAPSSAGRFALVGASVLSGALAGTAVAAIISGTLTQFPP